MDSGSYSKASSFKKIVWTFPLFLGEIFPNFKLESPELNHGISSHSSTAKTSLALRLVAGQLIVYLQANRQILKMFTLSTPHP